ncbi:DNA-repair protein [Actinidia chinensis var. chinensis]|uniref:DNA-repair protein n=1 Tax=Actinidia chinensis var. chinensis TaxID=1590841 RepID=A0A2R6QZV6_ACTCC|nr:DNA-repair protein [Actinidia chinensis var. chinensis]
MSDSNANPSNVANKKVRRNLPSWMSSRENESESHGKKLDDVDEHEEDDGSKTPKQVKDCDKQRSGSTPSKKTESNRKLSPSSFGATNFSKLLEGVVFVLSGFVNPERSILRSQALEMGADYQPDWNSNCTLLVCAFSNTPKFRQVEADCGTIISKEWISECYSQKKLVDIESYLMHAGKPWRRQNISHESSQDTESSVSRKSPMQIDRGSHAKSASSATKSGTSNPAKEFFSSSKVKKWAIDDLEKTISWLESQEEKPEASEIKKIAAEGILTCLQDAIDSLKQKQDVQQMTEQWNFIPRVVEELAKLEGTANGSVSLSKEELYREAMSCKQIYEVELGNFKDDSLVKKKKPRTDESKKDGNDKTKAVTGDAAAYDSDETIEMTEEEIDLAYNTVASKLSKR